MIGLVLAKKMAKSLLRKTQTWLELAKSNEDPRNLIIDSGSFPTDDLIKD